MLSSRLCMPTSPLSLFYVPETKLSQLPDVLRILRSWPPDQDSWSLSTWSTLSLHPIPLPPFTTYCRAEEVTSSKKRKRRVLLSTPWRPTSLRLILLDLRLTWGSWRTNDPDLTSLERTLKVKLSVSLCSTTGISCLETLLISLSF